MTKPTLFFVTDIETMLKKRIAFDVAWRVVDRNLNVYDEGSYIIGEAFKHDVPFFKEKLGYYFDDTFNKLIVPASILEVREIYNAQIKKWRAKGHRVILCAYNARFDFTELPKSLRILTDNPEAKWLDEKIELLDIWDYWGQSVPLHYGALPTGSGKYISTSAESAYIWEFVARDFVERHMAWHDCVIEAKILQKALSRKKKMPLVNNPSEFAGAVWQKINRRLGFDGKTTMPPSIPEFYNLCGQKLAA